MKHICLLILVCLVLFTACSESKPPHDMSQIYSLALDTYITKDEALNDQMQFIALDFKNKELNGTDKENILTIGLKVVVEYKKNKWKVTKSDMTWIS